MSLLVPAEPHSHERLLRHLAPELAAALLRAPSPAVLAEAERALRDELLALAAFVPQPLVRAQLANPQPGRVSGAFWRGSVLFADMSGFTALTERLSALGRQGAEEISTIINRLFAALAQEVHAQGGALLKFGGDALTAFFDAALHGEGHAALAAAAALAMQRRMDGFAALETRAGPSRLQLRVGVHSGRIFAAQVGDVAHIELVITGPNVNRVALAQEIAEPGEVVVSDATLALLAPYAPHARERRAGFHLLDELPTPPPHAPQRALIEHDDTPSLASLDRRAQQIEALRPYLLGDLPRRFIAQGKAGEVGEFRPVSVLFANFYPFNTVLEAFGERPDLAAQALNAFYRRAQAVIHTYGGVVNKVDLGTFGDKLMALFGAPVAHEDDPLRAARAALALRPALEAANAEIANLVSTFSDHHASAALGQRIGINTGPLFAGRVGSPERYEYTVMGPAVNLAARLMSSGEEGDIVLSPGTRRAVERSIAVEPMPPLRLKGIAEPVPAARALRAYDVERVAALGDGAALPRAALVGRADELDHCLAVGRIALRGAGRALAVVGDAGIGKTRLMEELVGRLVMESVQPDGVPEFAPFSADCQSYEQRAPYAAIRPLLREVLGLDTGRARAAHPGDEMLGAVREFAPSLERFAPLLGDIVGQPAEETPITAALSPEQRHDRAQELVEALICGAARRQPLILVVDDLHWADASSRELFGRLAAADAPLLLVLCYRPDAADAPWADLPTTTRLVLRELSPASASSLAASMLGGSLSPALAPVIERTQGNPFFIEELIRSLVATGALAREPGGAWRLARALDDAALPDSIEGVLLARLDRLGEAERDLVQIASVVGRRFPEPVLAGVYARPHALGHELRGLTAADIFVADEPGRDATYLFRHTLVRDVAYEGILYARRRELHRRVAQRIAALHGPDAPEQTALLARHYLLAEEWEPAFRYHLLAGSQAQASYANAEALALFAQALQIALRHETRDTRHETRDTRHETRDAASPSEGAISPARVSPSRISPSPPLASPPLPFPLSQLVEIHERAGVIHNLVGEYDEALADFQRALDLLAVEGELAGEGVVRLHRHIAAVYERRADFEAAFAWLERGMARGSGDTRAELTRCYLLGAGIYLRQGSYQQSAEWARMGRALAERQGNEHDQAKADKLLGAISYSLGDYGRAVELGEQSLRLFAKIGDIQEQAGVNMNLGNAQHELGRWHEARASYEASARLNAAVGNAYEQAILANNLGDVLRNLGDLEGAIEQGRTALAGLSRSLYGSGVAAMNLGATYILRGDLGLAAAELDRADGLFAQAGTDSFLPELLRYRAELALAHNDAAGAIAFCGDALAHAQRLGARLEEGTARRVLAQALAAQGDLAAADAELDASEAALREAGNRYELARSAVQRADVLARLGRHDEAAALVGAAHTTLADLGAQRDLALARAVAERWGFSLELP